MNNGATANKIRTIQDKVTPMRNDVYGVLGVEEACPREKCPVATTLSVISGKWKGVILYHLFQSTLRFSELQRRMEGVTHRSLTLQLRELEEDGIIERTVYPEVPPRVEYSLSELGRTMEPIIAAMFEWGVQYKEQVRNTRKKV